MVSNFFILFGVALFLEEFKTYWLALIFVYLLFIMSFNLKSAFFFDMGSVLQYLGFVSLIVKMCF